MGYVKVENSNGVEFHWNSAVGIRYNIQANIEGFWSEEGEQESFEGYLSGSHSKTEVKAAKELLDGIGKYHSEAKYLEQVVEPLFHDLPSHRNGKPSLLYAVIQKAIQESTKKRRNGTCCN